MSQQNLIPLATSLSCRRSCSSSVLTHLLPPSTKDTNLFAVTSSGSTPFLAGCEGGRVDVVRTLMEKAIAKGKLEDMCNQKDTAGKTPFDMAAAGQHKVRPAGDIRYPTQG